MGNAYTTSTKVMDELPSDVPADVQAKFAGWIEDASRKIDANLPGYETPFNAITDTPPTPSEIEEAARYLVIDRAMRKMGLLRYDDKGSPVEKYKADATEILRKLREGESVIPEAQLP